MRAEWGLQLREPLHRGLRAAPLVLGRNAPALRGLEGNGDEVGLDVAAVVRRLHLLLAEHAEAIRALLGELREPVVQAFGGHAHVQRVRADHLLRDEAWVRISALADRVTSHVLNAAGDGEVVLAGADRCAHERRGGHRARAHAVERKARNRLREAGEDRNRTAEGQALVTLLGRCGNANIVNSIERNLRVSLHESLESLDG